MRLHTQYLARLASHALGQVHFQPDGQLFLISCLTQGDRSKWHPRVSQTDCQSVYVYVWLTLLNPSDGSKMAR